MGSNRFGNIFCITTWGEAHGKAIGVVIDGCPAGLLLTEDRIHEELKYRRPGYSPYTSPRREEDRAEILSGVFEGKTTGTPISLIIFNQDVRSSPYEPLKDFLKPGHANYTYLEKYGIYDYRGSGRASARETACRVAAGAVAKLLLEEYDIHITAFMREVGGIAYNPQEYMEVESLKEKTRASPLFCPDIETTKAMAAAIETAKAEGDSLGGIVELRVEGLPPGLGDPIYEKLEANLGKAMLSIPACKGFEVGSGFEAARMRGSVHNDLFAMSAQGSVITRTNHAGGLLGGITNGMPLVARAAFKPPSSLGQSLPTIDRQGHPATIEWSKDARHDPCVALRGVAVVEAMAALVLADALLMHRSSKMDHLI